jgi:hypothetical protein
VTPRQACATQNSIQRGNPVLDKVNFTLMSSCKLLQVIIGNISCCSCIGFLWNFRRLSLPPWVLISLLQEYPDWCPAYRFTGIFSLGIYPYCNQSVDCGKVKLIRSCLFLFNVSLSPVGKCPSSLFRGTQSWKRLPHTRAFTLFLSYSHTHLLVHLLFRLFFYFATLDLLKVPFSFHTWPHVWFCSMFTCKRLLTNLFN